MFIPYHKSLLLEHGEVKESATNQGVGRVRIRESLGHTHINCCLFHLPHLFCGTILKVWKNRLKVCSFLNLRTFKLEETIEIFQLSEFSNFPWPASLWLHGRVPWGPPIRFPL